MKLENTSASRREHLKKFINSPVCGVLLFVSFLLIFTWPFVGLRALQSPKSVMIFLFGTWAALIVIHWYQDRLSTPRGDKNV